MAQKKNSKRVIILIAVSVAVLAVIGIVLSRNKKANQQKMAVVSQQTTSVAVSTAPVIRESVRSEFSANGNFLADKRVDFSSETAGRVLRVSVDEGDYVRPGQELAVIKAEAANVDLENAQAAYNNAVKDKERFENAYKTGGVTQQQLDQARLALKNAESRLNQTQLRYNDAFVKSNISGVVNKRLIEPGSFVGIGTPLFEIVNISTLNLRVAVDESHVGTIKIGDKVEVKATAMPDKTFYGTVKFIAVKADEALNFPVDVTLVNTPDNALRAGMYGTATFRPQGKLENNSGLAIPRSAFIGGVNAGEVYVVQNNRAMLKKITPGRIFGDRVEVIAGLSEGDVVIISGQINLQDGATVSVNRQ
ncbi:MAG: efflux RND transporter periplasmic adaptor subunit [Flavipsychrobacter sp.]|nr:efflux RND transporter periplasmic adaptor subunit [Flavipsychrobacter sp.]